MAEPAEKKTAEPGWKARLARALAFTLLAVITCYLLLTSLIATPFAANRLSSFLTSLLGQHVTVSSIDLSGGTLHVRGVTVDNPPGFRGAPLLAVGTITVAPDWEAILHGDRHFRTIKMEGLRVRIARVPGGAWNYGELLRRLTARKKKQAAEIRCSRLVLDQASLAVNGLVLESMALTVRDFSTRGSTGSRLLLTFRDAYGSPFRLEGDIRLGAEPAMALSLSSQALATAALGRFISGKALALQEGSAALLLTATLLKGELRTAGSLTFERLGVVLRGERIPIRGALSYRGRYDTGSDTAVLAECRLTVNDLVRLRAAGTVRRLKGDRAFEAEVRCDDLEVAEVFRLLPGTLRRDLLPAGKLTFRSLHISGDRYGILDGSGEVALRAGALAKGGRTLFRGLAADASLAGGRAGWSVRGKCSLAGQRADDPLETLDIPFIARLSSRLKPLSAEIPAFYARITGLPLRGSLAWRPSVRDPFHVRLRMSDPSLDPINRRLAGKNAALRSARLAVSAEAAGEGPGRFVGSVTARVLDLRGSVRGKDFSLARGTIGGGFGRTSGRFTATGSADIAGAFAGKGFGASFACNMADDTLTLRNGKGLFGPASFTFAAVTGSAMKPGEARSGRIPLSLSGSGIDIAYGEARLAAVSGSVNVGYLSDEKGHWLEGNGSLALPSLTYRGKQAGSCSARLGFARGGTVADLSGSALGGEIGAELRFDPLAAAKGGTFAVRLRGVDGARVGELAGPRTPALTGGVFAGEMEGSYAPDDGLACRMLVTGERLTLAGKGGKTLVSGAGLKLRGAVRKGDLSVEEGLFSAGKEVTLRMHGEVRRFASRSREGNVSFSAPPAPLNALIDSFANLLPAPLQQAEAGGAAALDGTLRLGGERTLLEGKISLADARLEIAAQKLVVSEIGGAVPFSLDLSGKGAERPRDPLSYTRNNYPTLLQNLRQSARTGEGFRIGRVCFGPMEIGEMRLSIRAADGLTEVTSLESSLYGGTVHGKGFFRLKKGAVFGGDLLVRDLSLRELCNALPAIKGHISGRVDGIVSLHGEGKGLGGVTGFVDLWTRGARGEKMLVSKEFLQKLAGKKLRGFFFREDRPYDRGEVGAYLEKGYLTFYLLDISHTNLLGIRDLSVSVAPVQNRIALDHLLQAVREAAARGKAAKGVEGPMETAPQPEFKWME